MDKLAQDPTSVLSSRTLDGQSAGSSQVGSPLVESLVGKKVLIVEDEAMMQFHLKTILERVGMCVVGLASNGEQGLTLAKRLQPDVVLMDVQMQGETDGIDATRHICQEQRSCVIMITAYSSMGDEALAAGASGYLVKPVTMDFLVGYIEGVVRQFYGPQVTDSPSKLSSLPA